MKPLNGASRKHLRALAHPLKPTVQVGKSGLTDGLIGSIEGALNAHELIKIKFIEFKDERRSLADEIARRTNSHGVGLIGNIAILYREHPDPEQRKIRLPGT